MGVPDKEAPLSETFDVFLSHNSKDKPAVRTLAEALRDQRDLEVWLDEWELPPGRPWQDELDQIIRTVRSAAVLVGKDGLGPWELPEMRACLSQMVKRKLPVIPVLLPDAPDAPDLPVFLAENTWVDLRGGFTEDGLDRLQWGITGTKPARKAKQPSRLTGPRIHNLPFPPLGDLLKGRDEELQRLEANLQNQATAITQAIHGLGGIGKTRLAVEYAWRSGNRYDAALLVVAESPQALQSGLADLARVLKLPRSAGHGEAEIVETVLSWLAENPRWLLILDNVDTPEAAEAVRKILPRLQNGHVLITSRRRAWPASVRSQVLDTLTKEEATSFLLERTKEGRSSKPDDPEQAGRLADLLDGLPLALEQAGAYIVHHQISFSNYLKDWEKERENVLAWHNDDLMEYPASVATTWQTTFRQLSPTAAAILRLTAYLAPGPISLDMFENGEEIVKEAAEAFCEEIGVPPETKAIRAAAAELSGYSMVTKDGETFTVHRIVQEVLRAHLPEERRRDWIAWSLQLVDDFSPVPPDDVRTWPVWDSLRPHATAVIGHANRAEISTPAARLMAQLALLLKTKGLFVEAEPLIRQALAITEQVQGPDHSEVATCLNNLAALLQATNRLSEAEPMKRRALEIDEAAFRPTHPNVARDLNNLAQLLKATNRLSEAEPLMRRSLEIDESAFGPTHPNVARDLNNLAQLLQATNRLSEAEPMMRRSLGIDESAFGPTHPDVARDLNNLAQLLQATNRLSEAEPLMRRALEIDEAAFGPTHPNVAIRLNNLASLLQATNRLSEAEPMMRRALEIDEAAFGPTHPNVAIRLNNLAALLQATNRLSEAEPLMRRSLEIFEGSLGTEHPNSQIARRNLEILLRAIASAGSDGLTTE